jgi:hypothetical protein
MEEIGHRKGSHRGRHWKFKFPFQLKGLDKSFSLCSKDQESKASHVS